jgi:hypothetical protein
MGTWPSSSVPPPQYRLRAFSLGGVARMPVVSGIIGRMGIFASDPQLHMDFLVQGAI